MNDPDNLYEAEHNLINDPDHGMPIINAMGADQAVYKAHLNRAVREQLRFVFDQIQHYVPMTPRNFGDDNQMPHEWGSMDTYDDMRNSLAIASGLMDMLIDFQPFDLDACKELIRERGICASPDSVFKELFGTDDTDKLISILDEGQEN